MNKTRKFLILGIVSVLFIGGIVYAYVRNSSTNKTPDVAIKNDINKEKIDQQEKARVETTTPVPEPGPKTTQTPTPAPAPKTTPVPKQSVTPSPSSSNNAGTNVVENKAPNYTSGNTMNSSITYWQEVESIIFTKVNAERAKVSQPALVLNSQMTGLAREKSKEMIELNYFDHKSPTNGYIQEVMSKRGIPYSAVGENIAMLDGMNLSANDMANKLMDMWMNSAGHRANILSPNFKQIGIGVARKGNLVKATQVFYTR